MAARVAQPTERAPSVEARARVPVTATARNVAILRAARDLLAATLAVTSRESAISAVERALQHQPQRRLIRRMRSRWAWRIGTLFAAADVAAVVAAWLLAAAPLTIAQLTAPAVVVLLVGHSTNLHESRLNLSVLDDLPTYVLAAMLAGLTIAGAGRTFDDETPTWQRCVAFTVLCFLSMTVLRTCAYAVVRLLRRGHLVSHPVVIVGDGHVGQHVAGAMLAHPEYGLAPVGFIVSEAPDARSGHGVLPLLGGLGALPDVLRRFDVQDVVFAFGAHSDAQLVRVVRACVRMDMQVFVVPRYFELFAADRRARVEMLWDVPLVRLKRWPLRPSRASVKRALDVGLATVGLVVLAPVMALCAVAVRLEGGPGFLFRQVRVGRNGQAFMMLKFRSMRPAGDDGDRRWSIDGDDGITRVGRFLRRSSLDELPQLINVLHGDMSIVGPRPERPYFAQNFAERFLRYGDRLRIAGGLTGWAQVNGLRGDTSIEDRVTFDNYYIDNWSLWSDVKIILRTLPAMARRASRRADPGAEVGAVAGAPQHKR